MNGNRHRDSDQIPDVVLLAHGDRWAWVARLLALPAKIVATLSLSAVVLEMAFDGNGLLYSCVSSALLIALLWTFWRPRDERGPILSDRAGTAGLLETAGFLIALLERGDDDTFNRSVLDFAGALDRLTPDERREIDSRGADHQRLRAGLYSADNELRDPAVDRQTLHDALQNFIAAGRQPTGNMAYRSEPADGSDSVRPLESGAGVEIRRALRVRLVATAMVVMLIWVGVVVVWVLDWFRLRTAVYLALAATPLFMLVAARFTREAAERSWTAAAGRPWRASSASPRMRRLAVAAMFLSWIPLLDEIAFVSMYVEELWSFGDWLVSMIGLFTVGPVMAHAILERRRDILAD